MGEHAKGKGKKKLTGVESRGHFVISRLVVKHPFGWGAGGVLVGVGCLHGRIPLSDGCDGGRNGRESREMGTKLVPDTLGVPLVCPLWPQATAMQVASWRR